MTKINPCTLVFLIRDNHVLLALKHAGEGVAGTLIGPGGKIEPGETAYDCAIRETKEEIGVTIINPGHVGYVEFDFTSRPSGKITTGEVYTCTKWQGTPQSSDELDNPTWYPINNLPVDKMSPEKKLWVPQVLAGEKVRAIFRYNGDGILASHDVEIVETLS